MKTLTLTCALVLVTSAAFASLTKDEIKRLDEAAAILTELRNSPDKDIPQQLWEKAECAVVIPSMKKAAFVVGGEYGAGVMSCRHGGDWSAPVFMQLAKGSWGLQIGAEQVDLVLLVMNRRGVEKMLQDKVSLGADASAAAGPVGRSAHAATNAQMNAEMLSYSRAQGVFAGIDLSGGVLRPDKEANAHAYGPDVEPHDIVMGARRVEIPPAAHAFLGALRRNVSATTEKK
jgi:SH3 domain-containing YSC84-like protein 1